MFIKLVSDLILKKNIKTHENKQREVNMVVAASQPELVLMSLSNNKEAAHTLFNEPPNKGGMIQRAGCLPFDIF